MTSVLGYARTHFRGGEYRATPLSSLAEEVELFDPYALGLEPQGMCTACWRGYLATFGLDANDRLVLADLLINLDEDPDAPTEAPPELNSVSAEPANDDEDLFQYRYLELNLPLAFTGGLLIATGFLEAYYEHMGFHPAWKFQRVIELTFQAGQLTGRRDVSELIARLREQIVQADSTNRTAASCARTNLSSMLEDVSSKMTIRSGRASREKTLISCGAPSS